MFAYIEKMTQSSDKQIIILHYWYERPDVIMEKYDIKAAHYARLHYRPKQRLENNY